MAINPISFSSNPIVAPSFTPPAQAPAPEGAFKDALNSAIQSVNGVQQNAEQAIGRFLSGEGDDLHHVALEQQRAAITFDLFLQVRNKVVNAYQEVMRMPL